VLALAAILAYAVLAGADFGGGVWDLLSGPARKREQREAIGEAMGPVWETNHVWLIYVLVLLFTCFPPVFAMLGIALFVPLTLALIGIVLRGAAFAFRGPAIRDLLPHKIWGVVFGIASLATPFLFGACAGGIATGSFGWLRPMSLTVGLFAVTLCAQLAAVFLVAETRGPLRDDFRVRAYWSTCAVAVLGLAALIAGWMTEPRLIAHLRSPVAVAAVACAMALGVVVLLALRASGARCSGSRGCRRRVRVVRRASTVCACATRSSASSRTAGDDRGLSLDQRRRSDRARPIVGAVVRRIQAGTD
jgi:cytochrome d ubiquinol oxidase subunit II